MRFARVASGIALAALLGGCAMVRIAYNNAEPMVRYTAHDYFDLNERQNDQFRKRLLQFHDWHRANELPLYARLLRTGAQRGENGITREDVAWAAAEMRALGALRADSPRAVAERVELVLTIVTADPDVREVILGPDGVLEGMKPGGVIVDMSTISPMTIQDVARIAHARGVEVMDAPVSGGDTGAKAGTLTIIAGGEKGTFERSRPVFEAMGNNI